MKVYIAGKITGNENYREEFAKAQAELAKDGHIVLNPAVMPEGLTKAEYMRICFSMIDIADQVVLLPGWQDSEGAKVEYAYCLYVGKKVIDRDIFRHAKTQTAGQMKDCIRADVSRIFAEKIRDLIDRSGLTREEIAKRLDIDTSTVTKYYNGNRKLTIEAVRKFSVLFGVSADWLLGLDEEG